MQEIIFIEDESYLPLTNYIKQHELKKILLVCESFITQHSINDVFKNLEHEQICEIIRFSDFEPNPKYESVVAGLALFHKQNCEAIIAVGGGSAMDVAKCIKLFANMDAQESCLAQKITPNDYSLIAIPTTSGTGSEATRFAVIYYKGEKQSIVDDSCIPSVVLFDAGLLKKLPMYQRKVTMLDALCHSIESLWSVNSTDESKLYAKEAINMILLNKESYLNNEPTGNAAMQKAAYIAGKAINITQTTAGHAMSYKLTSIYGIAHGHAVALCVRTLWPYMLNHIESCSDSRGSTYLQNVFAEIAISMGGRVPEDGVRIFDVFLTGLQLPALEGARSDIAILEQSVNLERLKNNPICLNESAIAELYVEILNVRG